MISSLAASLEWIHLIIEVIYFENLSLMAYLTFFIIDTIDTFLIFLTKVNINFETIMAILQT